MAEPGNKILVKMLERLFASLLNGPGLNCRPHSSRQRVDLTHLSKLDDARPETVLADLLQRPHRAKLSAKVTLPARLRKLQSRANANLATQADYEPDDPRVTKALDADAPGAAAPDPSTQPAESTKRDDPRAKLSEEDRAAIAAWTDQQWLMNKLRVIADDARTYEQDTGVHVLHIGFPLLSIPPEAVGGAGRAGAGRRIIAPIAFIPVNLLVKRSASTGIDLACRGEGSDLVMPNAALLSWIERHTGKQLPELFDDEEGTDAWREIVELVRQVCTALEIDVPADFAPAPPPTPAPAPADPDKPSETPAADASAVSTDAPTAADAASADGAAADRADPKSPESPPIRPSEVPTLSPAPKADETADRPVILMTAILGLFPMANQGLLRDMQAMADGEELVGPVQSFIRAGISLDITPSTVPNPLAAPAADESSATRRIGDERMIAPCDPCQGRAVRLARESKGLVVHGPPGTGKSQTITNMIGDHLVRGQRVLVVCDKRTALDVVANRLKHMGLGKLVAIVHDPQRDQRELYKSVRDQLDELTDVRAHPSAAKKLKQTDDELESLHRELSQARQALLDPMIPAGDRKLSFHDVVGQWLAASIDTASPPLDATAAANVPLDLFTAAEAPLRAALSRAESVNYGENPWADAAGDILPVLLSRPIEQFRKSLDACVAAAQAADTVADPAIPPFSPSNLPAQATARVELADALQVVLASVAVEARTRWASANADEIRRVRLRLREAEPFIKILRSAPLDAELALAAGEQSPGVSILTEQLRQLAAYRQAAGRWWGFLAFGAKRRAAAIVNRLAMSLDPATAERAEKFLVGLRARLMLRQLHHELTGVQSPSLPEDRQLDSTITQHEQLLPMLERLHSDPALASPGLAARVIQALTAPATAAPLIDGLRKSPDRAAALMRLDASLAAAAVFHPDWRNAFMARLLEGSTASPTITPLSERLGTLEAVLRTRQELTAIPLPLRSAAESLARLSAGTDETLQALRREILAGEISRRLRDDTRLQGIEGRRMQAAFDRYRQLELEKRDLVRDVILLLWIERQRQRLLAANGGRLGPMGADLRRRLIMRGERAMRLRKVIEIGQQMPEPDPLFDICPVWLASPETVAQLFPRRKLFDVVIFDEASQCRLEEALPVLIRAERVVIAGDPQQLPPTRFFESALAQSDEDQAESDQELFEQQQGEIEDLLTAALNLEIRQSYLDVHYRSRNSDLIGFSNLHFYGSRLQAIPSPRSSAAEGPPIKLYRVDGVYDHRCNPAEAGKVCDIVQELLDRPSPPSIGIACFNLQQRDLIVETLEERAESDEPFAQRLTVARERQGAGSFEGLFVKNLENVQGDERDHIIISTTYGNDPRGRFYRRFGPVGRAGGGRRLNVLITRARERVHLVTSIPADAYRALPPVPDGQLPGGTWLLFAYLKYAESLQSPVADDTRAPRSDDPNSLQDANSRTSRSADSTSPRDADAPTSRSAVSTSLRDADATTSRSVPAISPIDADARAPRAADQPESPPAPRIHIYPTRAPSSVAEALAERLRRAQIGSDVYWGNDGFCVDIAIRAADSPHVPDAADAPHGILCDLARFTNGADPIEWDVFRTTIHESQGWTLHRLWSPSLFRDAQSELAALP